MEAGDREDLGVVRKRVNLIKIRSTQEWNLVCLFETGFWLSWSHFAEQLQNASASLVLGLGRVLPHLACLFLFWVCLFSLSALRYTPTAASWD